MRLSAKMLSNWSNVNSFSYSFINQWQIRAGDPNTLYFQLVDLSQAGPPNGALNNFGQVIQSQTGLRYLAGIGTQNQPYSVLVTCPSIDNSKVLQFQAFQADPNDSSIWAINIAATQIPNSGNVLFAVTEGTATRTFSVMNGMSVEIPGGSGSC